MSTDHEDDGTLREFDFTNAVRGAFANRWTPEEREQILRDSIVGTVRAWHRFALVRVQPLEASLYTYSVVAASASRDCECVSFDALPFSAIARLVSQVARSAPLHLELQRRLDDLAGECNWAADHGLEGMEGSAAERLAHIERLERIGREAEAVKVEVDAAIQRHLARSGMSAQEIERKTEETARLWQAA